MMTGVLVDHCWVVLLLPFLSFLLGICGCRKLPWQATAGIAVVLHGLAMCWALGLAWQFQGFLAGGGERHLAWEWTWFHLLDGFDAKLGCLLDPISVMMLVVITVIAFLVQVYSIGYMREDKSAARFFPLLSFFAMAMLGLVLASNLLQLFVFWELVGVASYLLIGFWYHKPEAVAASKKAFIITRFADAFFLMGIIILALVGGSADFAVLLDPTTTEALRAGGAVLFGCNLLTIATLLVFTGGWGKSAMFPLHIWLPDAMEGPTPVSSIIHSATMVVAGIYLTARMFPLFAEAEVTMLVVETTGVVTALFAALVACTQRDIKRILAFSTLSQLGYMMFSLGVADAAHPLGYTASMFHVFTHAFFKCLLFLAAGLIIHAVHSNDIAKMGGLRKKLPVTWFLTLLACLAIGGVPPLAGFFSKDEILLAAWAQQSYLTFALGAAVGGLTAFYMFRFFFLIFHGAFRGDEHSLGHMHEDKTMLAPMLVLGLPTVLAGLLAKGWFSQHVVPPGTAEHVHPQASWLPWMATLIGLSGIAAAWFCYGRGAWRASEPRGILRHIANKLYIDEVWLWFTKTVMFRGVAEPAKWCDDHLVDGAVDGTSDLAQQGGTMVRWWQNGQLHTYLTVMAVTFILIALWKGVFA